MCFLFLEAHSLRKLLSLIIGHTSFNDVQKGNAILDSAEVYQNVKMFQVRLSEYEDSVR